MHDASNGPEGDLYDPNVIQDGNGGTEVNDSGQHLQCQKQNNKESALKTGTHTTEDGIKLKTTTVVYACRIVLQSSTFNFLL